MGHFILKHSWFVLCYIIRFFGIYPLQRDGETGIILTSTCKFWLRYICTLLFAAFLHGSVHLYVYVVKEINPIMFLNAAMGKTMSKSGIDKLVIVFIPSVFLFMHIVSIAKLRTLAKGICIIQQNGSKNAQINEKALEEKTKNSLLKVSFYIILLQSGVLLITIGAMKQVHSGINISELVTNAYIITYLAYNFVTLAPTLTFVIIYFNLTNFLYIWCDEIMNNKSDDNLLQKAKHFIEELNNIAQHFAHFLFWIISINQVVVIFLGYITISVFISEELKHWETICVFVGFVLFDLALIFGTFILCHTSESLANKVQELKKVILNIEFQTGQSNAVFLKLDEFQGFIANGYFTLNHSLITSLTTNFLTFLVILVQFKQTESSN